MSKKLLVVACGILAAVLMVAGLGVRADEFTKEDVERYDAEFMSVVKKGQALWGSPDLGTNKVACGQCHPNAANTHPETYPKFQKQLGRVIAFREMINWCIRNPLEGEELSADDPRMTALQAYITYERRGVVLEPGKH